MKFEAFREMCLIMGPFKTTLRKPWLWAAQQLPKAKGESNFFIGGCCLQKTHFYSKCYSSTFSCPLGGRTTLQSREERVHAGWFVYLLYIFLVQLSIASYFLGDIPGNSLCMHWILNNLNLFGLQDIPKWSILVLLPNYISVYISVPKLNPRFFV